MPVLTIEVLQSFAEERSNMQTRLAEQAQRLEELEATNKELKMRHDITLQVCTSSQTSFHCL